ncbi:MAG: hypothetical protein R3F59_34590 [Myxococcota bacterium]
MSEPQVLQHEGAVEVRYDIGWSEVVERWQHDEPFVDAWTERLASLPNAAIFWETPPVTAADRPFAYVAVDAPGLARAPADEQAFAGPWASAPAGPVATFANLGRDAVLVTPRPLAGPRAAQRYPHLLAFVRTAPQAHQRALWRAVGAAVAARRSARPVWVSTAGMGVFWLHVRLDDRPKYYRWRPYRDDPGA